MRMKKDYLEFFTVIIVIVTYLTTFEATPSTRWHFLLIIETIYTCMTYTLSSNSGSCNDEKVLEYYRAAARCFIDRLYDTAN